MVTNSQVAIKKHVKHSTCSCFSLSFGTLFEQSFSILYFIPTRVVGLSCSKCIILCLTVSNDIGGSETKIIVLCLSTCVQLKDCDMRIIEIAKIQHFEQFGG